MKNVKQIYIYSVASLIICLWPWGHVIGSHDRSNPVLNGINKWKSYEDSFSKQETELLPLSSTKEEETRPKELQSRGNQNTKSARQRVKFNSEEINSTADTECVETEETGIVNNGGRSVREQNQMKLSGRLNDAKSYTENRRKRRDSQSVGPSSTTPEGSPEGSPEGTSEGSPEGKSEGSPSKPLTTSEPRAAPEQSWPEPEPDWPKALAKWKDAWPLHTYGFAVVFTIIALVPPFELFKMYADKVRVSTLKATLLIIIFLFSSTRALALYVDPYGSNRRFHVVVTQLLFSLGHPCIISALSLLLFVLLDTTKMNIAPPRFQQIKFIIPVVVSHVALVIVTDFVVVYFLEAKILLLICQIYFLLLGTLMSMGYITVGWKIRKNIKANVRWKSSVDNSMRRLQYLIVACAVSCISLCALTVYSAAGVFGIYSDVENVEAWPWWTFQTLNRLLEVVICIVVLLMNTKTTKRKIMPSFMTSVFKPKASQSNAIQAITPEKISCQSIASVE